MLERQSPPAQRFLLATGLLDRMCAPLCAAVLGIDEAEAQRILDDLDRANLFLVPLDDERSWFRYHHLFADVLRARVARRDGGARLDVHRRAGAWFAEAGLLPEAVDQALAAGSWVSAAARTRPRPRPQTSGRFLPLRLDHPFLRPSVEVAPTV